MKLRVDGKDAYIGKASTSGTYRSVYSQYTSRQVDVTYVATGSGSGSYTYPIQTTIFGPSSTQTGVTTWASTTGQMTSRLATSGSTFRTQTGSHLTTWTYEHAGSTYNSGGPVYDYATVTATNTYKEYYNITGTVQASSTWSQVVGGAGVITTVQGVATSSGSGTYRATSYTYKDDGYNTWYVTQTTRDYGNINM